MQKASQNQFLKSSLAIIWWCYK